MITSHGKHHEEVDWDLLRDQHIEADEARADMERERRAEDD